MKPKNSTDGKCGHIEHLEPGMRPSFLNHAAHLAAQNQYGKDANKKHMDQQRAYITPPGNMPMVNDFDGDDM